MKKRTGDQATPVPAGPGGGAAAPRDGGVHRGARGREAEVRGCGGDAGGAVVKLFRFEHPTQTNEFLHVEQALCAGVEAGKVAAETGVAEADAPR